MNLLPSICHKVWWNRRREAISIDFERHLFHMLTHLNSLWAEEEKDQEPPTSPAQEWGTLPAPGSDWDLPRDLKHPMGNRCQPVFLSWLTVMGAGGKGTEWSET